MSDQVEAIKTRMIELSNFIQQADDSINGGQMVDLQGLDDEVASLCDRSLALPPQQAIQIQPVMADMITKLEALGTSLQRFQDNLATDNGE